ncbi:methyltransf_25 domain-containing protein, partial [Haematococcus lacustris]
MCSKGHFWCQNQFFGVDLSPLYSQAVDSYFSQVLVSTCATKVLDFGTVTEAMLQDILIPLELQVTCPAPCTVHGVAAWFDVFFNGSEAPL